MVEGHTTTLAHSVRERLNSKGHGQTRGTEWPSNRTGSGNPVTKAHGSKGLSHTGDVSHKGLNGEQFVRARFKGGGNGVKREA